VRIPRLTLLVPVVTALLLAVGGGARRAAADAGAEALDVLKAGLRADAPADRRRAVLDFGRVVSSLGPAQAQRGAVILRKAFDEEADGGVRRAVVRTLARLSSATAWVPVLLAAFSDRDPEVHAEARRAVLSAGGAFLVVVRRLLEEDQDPTFRANVLLLLRDRRKPDAIPILLDALKEHVRVQAAAVEALEAITGEAFGYDAAAWAAWAAKRPPVPPPPAGPARETVTVAPEDVEVKEPPPHVTRSLTPEFYGLKLTAKDVVFVVDVSGSVGSGGVERAKGELADAVERLGSDVRIAALFFDETVRMWRPEMVLATPAHKGELATFLRGIKPGKRTDVLTPLNAGLQILRRRLEEKEKAGEPFREAAAMIVVSDGVETTARTPPHVVEDKLDRLDLAHAVVHAVVLGGRDSLLLHTLARRAGGHYVLAR
jgi:hypothetical protein